MFWYKVSCNPYQPPECAFNVEVFKDDFRINYQREFSREQAHDYGFCCVWFHMHYHPEG